MRALLLGSFFLIALCLLSRQASANTFIIVIRTEEASLIAANSKIYYAEGAGPDRTCKIHFDDDVVWTAAGINSESNGSFKIDEIGRTAINGGGTLDEIAARFERGVEAKLKILLPKIKEQRPKDYEAIAKSQFPVTAALIRKGELRTVDFFMPDSNLPDKLEIRRGACPGQVCASGRLTLMMGRTAVANTELKQRPELWQQMGIIGTINYLINLVSKAEPATVGGPFSIVRVDKSGAVSWFQKGACE